MHPVYSVEVWMRKNRGGLLEYRYVQILEQMEAIL